MKTSEKWQVRFDVDEDNDEVRSTIVSFSLRTLIVLARRGSVDADTRLLPPGATTWVRPSDVTETREALRSRASAAQWRPGHEPGAWTVSTDLIHEERLALDELLDRMNRKGTINADTYLSVPGRPNEFRRAWDWPLFWTKFDTGPWVVRQSGGSEYVATGKRELREWLRTRRISPVDEVYSFDDGAWLRASTVT